MLLFWLNPIKSDCLVLRKFHTMKAYIWKSLEIFFTVDFSNLPLDFKNNANLLLLGSTLNSHCVRAL